MKIPQLKHFNSIDDRERTLLHAEILRRKGFLKRLYADFYHTLRGQVEPIEGKLIVELGSGGGFIKDIIPNAVTSDVLTLPAVDKVFSACDMPFADQSVDAIVMIDVLHHIPDARAFFREAIRCLRPGGRVVMIEPANTLFGRFIYTRFHHEGFDPASDWTFASEGPLASANGALPWIIFHRDRTVFEKEFSSLSILKLTAHTPLRYLLSGGFTLRQLVPSWSYPLIQGLEFVLRPLDRHIGLFETIVLCKK